MMPNKTNRSSFLVGSTYVMFVFSLTILASGSTLANDPTFSIEIVEVNGNDVGPAPSSDVTVNPGDILTVEFFLRDWSPNGEHLRGYQTQIDSSGYTSSYSGNIFPKDWASTTDLNGKCSSGGPDGVPNDDNVFIDVDDCFSNQSVPPGEPDPVGSDLGPWGISNPCTWFRDCLPRHRCEAPSIDWVFGQVTSGNQAQTNSIMCDYRHLGAADVGTDGPIASQDGTKYYLGTVVLEVSADARGTFTLCLDDRDDDPTHPGPDYSFVTDENNDPIVPVFFECATITVINWGGGGLGGGPMGPEPGPGSGDSGPASNIRPTPGYPRYWEGAISVSPYSVVNLANGNVLTTIPLTGLNWGGRGPGVSFAVYHNSATGGWTTSYSDNIQVVDPDKVKLVGDDGSEVIVNNINGEWIPEPGYHFQLQQVGNEWTVTFEDQTVDHFDENGLLTSITDPAGNVLTVNRDPAHNNRISSIADAPGRTLNFIYDPSTERLASIQEGFSLPNVGVRTWEFYYDGGDRLRTVTDPRSNSVVITDYYPGNRIRSIADKEGNVYNYKYSNGRLIQVNDPFPFNNQAQKFVYQFTDLVRFIGPDEETTIQSGLFTQRERWINVVPDWNCTTYFGRRQGEQWKVHFSPGEQRRLSKVSDPYGNSQSVGYDRDYNITRHCNELGNCWEYDFDDNGNMLSASDPLGNGVSFEYDSLNNLALYRDGASNEFELHYDDPNDPTAMTSFIEPADGQGNGLATTTLTYFGPEEPSAQGLLKTVTDPNGVMTQFYYDQYGQLMNEHQGSSEPGQWKKVSTYMKYDTASRLLNGLRQERWVDNGTRGGRAAQGERQASYNCDQATYCIITGVYKYNANGSRTQVGCDCVSPNWCSESSRGASQSGRNLFFQPPERRPDYGSLTGESNMQYDAMDRLVSATGTVEDSFTGEYSQIEFDLAYNELGLPVWFNRSSTEPTWNQGSGGPINRWFYYTYDFTNGIFERSSMGSQLSRVMTDPAGRVTHYERLTPTGTLTADFSYYANHQLQKVTYGNGTETIYQYDEAERLTSISHWQNAGSANLLLRLEYTYDARGLITQIDEFDEFGQLASATFTYDNRGRLISEVRIGDNPYNLAYTYDQVGNRLTKTATSSQPPLVKQTIYHYDVHAVADGLPIDYYGSQNNRLQYYEVFEDSQLAETVTYSYADPNAPGNPTLITRKPEGDPLYYGTYLTYNYSDQLWIVTEKTWEEGGANEQVLSITEFRGNGRQRYLVRGRDPNDPTQFLPDPVWTLYDAVDPYEDYTVTWNGQDYDINVLTGYEPGLGQVDWVSGETSYIHDDHLGTTRFLTDASGMPSSLNVYSAFGEKIVRPSDTRYGYAGAWGYEDLTATSSPLAANLLHVGYRHYSPSTGRFLERDPIGIFGGLNVYEYVRSNPGTRIDPIGLWFWEVVSGIASGAVTGLIVSGLNPVGAIVGGVAGGVAVAVGEIATGGKVTVGGAIITGGLAGLPGGAVVGASAAGASAGAIIGVGVGAGGVSGAIAGGIGNGTSGAIVGGAVGAATGGIGGAAAIGGLPGFAPAFGFACGSVWSLFTSPWWDVLW